MSRADPEFPCPLCRAPSRRLFAKEGIWIRACLATEACGHRFAEYSPGGGHVAHVYGDDYFTGGGAGYANYLSEAKLLRARGRMYARSLRRFVATGTILDVGAAAGFLLQGFRDLGWRTFGVEPNPAMAAYARARHGLDVVASSWEAFATDRRFDAIAMIQVLPHLADPRAALAQAAGLLKPGGGVLIETWNVESLTARAFGSAWHEYSPPSVLHWFSPKRLGRLAKTVGLAPWAVGRPSKCLDAGHAAGLLEYKFAGSRAGPAVRFLRRFVPANCPIPYPAEDLFWGYYVKNV